MKFASRWDTLGLLALFLLASISCSQSNSQLGPFRRLEFQVDSSRLGSSVLAGGLKLRVPLNWDPADSLLMGVVKQALGGDTTSYRFETLSLFTDSTSGSMALIKRFEPPPNEPFSVWARGYVGAFRQARPTADIREEWMTVASVPVVQLFMADAMRVHFSLLCDANPPIGVDYVVPVAQWEQQVRAVESSIGTISR